MPLFSTSILLLNAGLASSRSAGPAGPTPTPTLSANCLQLDVEQFMTNTPIPGLNGWSFVTLAIPSGDAAGSQYSVTCPTADIHVEITAVNTVTFYVFRGGNPIITVAVTDQTYIQDYPLLGGDVIAIYVPDNATATGLINYIGAPIPTATATHTPTPTSSPTPQPTTTASPTPTGTATPVPTASASVTPSPSPSGTTTPTPTPSPTLAIPIWMWGSNIAGQFGNNSTAAGLPATVVRYSPEWSQFCIAGGGFSAWLKYDGSLWLTGSNAYGQLGINNINNQSSLVQEITNSTWSLLGSSAGASAFAVKATDNKLYAWGENDRGKLGVNATGDRLVPTEVASSVTNWAQIVSSNSNTYAITTTGELYGIGLNNVGQLAQASALVEVSSPVQLVADKSWAFIQSGNNNFIGFDNTNTLWSWGYNSYGQVGNGTLQDVSSPVMIGAANEYSKVSCRADHVAALKPDGSVWVWGRNNTGQLGRNNTANASSPVQVATGVIDIQTGYRATYILKSDRTVWAVGTQANYNIGTTGNTNCSSFVQAVVGTTWADVNSRFGNFGRDPRGGIAVNLAAFATPTPTVTSSPTPTPSPSAERALYGWGENTTGALGLSNGQDQSKPIQIALAQYAYAGRGGNTTANAHYLKPDGSLWLAGDNSAGQLAQNNITDRNSPVQEISGSTWLKAFTARAANFAIKNDNTLWAWGSNLTNGLLGDGTKINRSSPVAVLTSNTNWASISCGYAQNAGITTDGQLWVWGNGGSGVLGTGNVILRSSMVQVAGTNWSTVSFGDDFAVALKTDGTAWSWGANAAGQLGINTAGVNASSPVQIGTQSNWSQLSAGGEFAYGLKADGSLWSWGSAASGVTGQGQDTVWTSSPTQVAGTWLAVQAMQTCAYAIDTQNRIFSVGAGTSGQLGLGNVNEYSTFQQIAGLEYIELAQVGAGTKVGMIWAKPVVTPTPTPTPTQNIQPTPLPTATTPPVIATIFGWGSNNGGSMLMNGTTTAAISPPTILRYTPEWYSVIKSGTTTAAGQALKFDGSMWMAGLGSSGQLAQNSTTAFNSMVQVGSIGEWATSPITIGSSTNTFYGVKAATGRLWAWGDGTSGRIGDGVSVDRSQPVIVNCTVTDWKSIAPSSTHVLGLRNNGEVWAWGVNTNGQLGDNTVISKSTPIQIGVLGTSFANIATGTSFSGGVKTDGTLWMWGLNTGGQLGINNVAQRNSPTQVGLGTDWSKVALGSNSTIGLKKDGTIWTWGTGAVGQLASGALVSRSSPVQVGTNTYRDVRMSQTNVYAIDKTGKLWSSGPVAGMPDGGVNASSLVQCVGLAAWEAIGFGVAGSLATGAILAAIPAATSTPSPTATISSTPTPTPSPSNSPSPSVTESPTPTPSPSETPNPTPTPSDSPTPSVTESPTPTPSPTIGYDIYAWGTNAGNFGNNTSPNASSPIFITGIGYQDMYNVFGSSWFQKQDGSMWVWGTNTSGRLGLNITTGVSSPTQLGTETTWSTFTIGTIAAATKTDGTLWTWGNNGQWALGLGLDSSTSVSSPTQVGTDTDWDSAYAGIGNANIFAIKKNGSLWVAGRTDRLFGLNYYPNNAVSNFVQLTSTSDWKWCYVNQYAPIFQKTDNTYWGLGAQTFGQFGLNNTISYSSPVQIGVGYEWESMTAANAHIAAIRSCDKSLWVCGYNTYGALGQNDVINRSQFVQVGTDTTWLKAIASGSAIGEYTMALKTDGTLWAFGGASTGALAQSNVNPASSPTQISAGDWLDFSTGIGSVFGLKAQSPLPTIGATLTPCPTLEPTSTPSPSPSESPVPTPTLSPEPTASPTPSVTLSPTPTPSTTASPTPSPSVTLSPTPTPSPTCTPSDLPVTSGLQGWFDASWTVGFDNPTNGAAVTNWNNRISNPTWTAMTQGTASKKPTYVTDGTTYGTYVQFDNTVAGDGMSPVGAYTVGGTFTMVVMEDCLAAISPSHRTLQSGSINALISLNQYAGATPIGAFFSSAIISGYLSGTGRHCGILTKTAGNALKYYVDNVDRTSGSPSVNASWGAVHFGASGANANEPANTKLLEVLIYDRVLSASELTQVNDYLQCKWNNTGITPYPTSTPSPTP